MSRPVKTKRPCLSIAEIEAKLREVDLQPTAQRIAICQYVLCEAEHPTAEEVKRWTDTNFQKLSLATVYNTLKALVEAKLLVEFRFPHSGKAIYDSNLEKHYHFLDEETGELTDLREDEVKVIPQLGKQFRVSSMEVVLRGRRK